MDRDRLVKMVGVKVEIEAVVKMVAVKLWGGYECGLIGIRGAAGGSGCVGALVASDVRISVGGGGAVNRGSAALSDGER